jgi:hypothetical protein
LGVQEEQGGGHRREGSEDGRWWSRPDREEEAEGEAREPEEDPEPAAEICSERLERDREECHPCRRKERKDAVDAEADKRPPPGDVELGPALNIEVVQVAGVLDDQPGAGRERGPVGVDDVVLAFDQRVDDKAKRNARQGDRPAPLPAGLGLQISSLIPSRAARTSVPSRWVRSAASSHGCARQTVIPK